MIMTSILQVSCLTGCAAKFQVLTKERTGGGSWAGEGIVGSAGREDAGLWKGGLVGEGMGGGIPVMLFKL